MTPRMTALAETLTGTATPRSLEAITLDDLFAEAESLGRLRIHPSSSKPPGHYCAIIEFVTLENIRLEARSAFGMTLKGTIREAITKARLIRGQFK